MSSVYLVTEINGSTITVTPEPVEGCEGCTSGCGSCSRNPVRIAVTNGRNFTLHTGDKVKIGMSATAAAVKGILALLFPVACAVLGYFLAPKTENMRALFVLIFLAAACIIVLVFTRIRYKSLKMEITEVC